MYIIIYKWCFVKLDCVIIKVDWIFMGLNVFSVDCFFVVSFFGFIFYEVFFLICCEGVFIFFVSCWVVCYIV